MRQARGAVAGLEDHLTRQMRQGGQRLVGLAGVDQGRGQVALGVVVQTALEQTGQKIAGLFERPGAGVQSLGRQVGEGGGRSHAAD